MQLRESYLLLRRQWSGALEGEPVRVTVAELAERLFCTPRNVNLLLKKMMEEGWLRWEPGNGRGHRSRLTFKLAGDKLVRQMAEERARRGDVGDALRIVRENGSGAEQERFLAWLSGQFGFHVRVEEEERVDVLRFPYFRPLLTLEPARALRQTERHMVEQVFDTLVRFEEETGEIVPHLAHFWEEEEGGLAWTFFVRKGVLFHDGRPLTAWDVAATMERLRSTESPAAWMFEDVEQVEAVERLTVRIRLRCRQPMFLHMMATYRAAILPAEAAERSTEQFERCPVGTGPFAVVQNDEGKIELRAFSPYFGGRAQLDRVEVWIVPEFLRQQELRHLGKHGMMSYPFLRETGKEEAAVGWPGIEREDLACKYLTFNLNRPGPQQHPLFREAMHRLIDRRRLVDTLGENRARPTTSWLPGESCAEEPDEAAAVRLLAATGYRGETLRLFTFEHTLNEEDAGWLQAECARCGICLEVVVHSFEELLRDEVVAEADLIVANDVREAVWDVSLLETFRAGHSFLRRHFTPAMRERVDSELRLIQQEPETHERRQQLRAFENRLAAERPYLLLYATRGHAFSHPALHGVELNALGFVSYRNLWFRSKYLHD
jgi:SgrR family transcriptional regulator